MGVDIGTTNTRAMAYGSDGRMLAEESEGYRLRHAGPGWAEQDPEEIFVRLYERLEPEFAAISRSRRPSSEGCGGEELFPVAALPTTTLRSP